MSDDTNRGLDPADNPAARAQHQVKLLEAKVRELTEDRDRYKRAAALMTTTFDAQEQQYQFALKLRDDAALAHEQERILRQEIQGDLDEVRAQLAEVRERETRLLEHLRSREWDQPGEHCGGCGRKRGERYRDGLAHDPNCKHVAALSPPASGKEDPAPRSI